MRSNTTRYRQWKKFQNEKNLKRRTKRNKLKKLKYTKQISYNRKLKENTNYNVKTKKYQFRAPLDFSLINNPEGTLKFFNDIIAFIINPKNFGKSLFIDISQINRLTIDGLMYLLAIVNNFNTNFRNRYSFSGNAPLDRDIRKLFSESGFYHFVHYQGVAPLTKNNDNVQIVSGEDCDTALAKRLSDFVCSKSGIGKRKCSFLYEIIIELMSNTHKHAYTVKREILHPRWYCFAEYNGSNTISFSFMDTGSGIPSTVKKSIMESVDFLGIKKDSEYVVSTLNGDFRTATKEGHRGKGLPKIREICRERKVVNMHILTNRAEVKVYEQAYYSKDISNSLRGTLYFWQIDIASLKGGKS